MKRYSALCAVVMSLLVWPAASGCNGDDDEMGSGSADDGANDGPNDGPNNAGDGTVDNVAACNATLKKLSCGDADLAQYVPCDQYASFTCDLADYFGCVEDNLVCTDGMIDAAGLSDCASLVACP